MEYLFRRNAVLEALRGSRRRLHCLWLQQNLARHQAQPLQAAAQQRGLPVKTASKQKLSQLAGDASHQGAVLEADPYPYSDTYAILALAAARREKPFLLLLDLLHGPQNIGRLLRTAEACGVHGVVVQERRAPDITPHVVTYSAGACEHLLIAKETNLVDTIRLLQAEDVWVAGLDVDEHAYRPGTIDLDRSLALVVGHEGSGLRRLVRESCDFLFQLPMRGQVESLNAAVAGSIALYLAWQSRGFPGADSKTLA